MIGFIALALRRIIFCRCVVPFVIESAYRGDSLPFLDDIISGQAVPPAEHYLAAWGKISWRMLAVVGLIPIPLLATLPEVQTYFEGRYGSSLKLKPIHTNTILALCGFALVFYLYCLHPVGHVYFFAEGYFAECGTFVSWAMASCLLPCVFFEGTRARKPGLFLLALGTFFVAMEEISWGSKTSGLTLTYVLHRTQSSRGNQLP